MTVTSTAASPDVASREASLELIGLRRRFGSVVALDDLTFSVPPGEVFGSWLRLTAIVAEREIRQRGRSRAARRPR